jgi:hypothetical protein
MAMYLFFCQERHRVESCDCRIIQLASLSRILSPQPLRPANLVGNGAAHKVHVLFAQSLQFAIDVLDCRVCPMTLGEDVGEFAQCHEVAKCCRPKEEVAEHLDLR